MAKKLSGKKKKVMERLKQNVFAISKTFKELGISRQTHYDWLNSDEAYKKSFSEIQEELKDIAESQLFKLIKKGNFQAIKFFLSTKGKDRGYGDKEEIEENRTIIINPIVKSNEEIKRERQAKIKRLLEK
ncbi:MAG: phBC6A51 family helix-turn-helix protein [Nanoarchaeota archaeon]